MSQLAKGAGDLGRGLAFLNRHPRLWTLVITPALITLLLMIALVVVATRLVAGLVDALTSHLPSWLEGVAGVGLTLLAILAFAAVGLLIFTSLAGALAGPFCELLSEAVEEQLDGRRDQPFQLGAFLRDATVGLGHTVRRLLASLLGAALLFAVSLLPVAGAVAALALGAWAAGNAAAYDCYDAVLARHAIPYRDKLAFLRAHRGRTFGLGLAVTGLMLIPGVNLVALGVGAVGATLATRELGGVRGSVQFAQARR